MAKFFTKLISETSIEVTEEYDGTVTITESEPENLMSFTIDGTTYQASDGMTWLEWVGSEYNTYGYSCPGAYGNVIGKSSMNCVARSNGTYVIGSEFIIASEAYKLVTQAGGAY